MLRQYITANHVADLSEGTSLQIIDLHHFLLLLNVYRDQNHAWDDFLAWLHEHAIVPSTGPLVFFGDINVSIQQAANVGHSAFGVLQAHQFKAP